MPSIFNSGNPFFDYTAVGTATAANVQTATLADGDIVVTWRQTNASSGETAIDAEILKPDGSVATPAFQVNTTTSGNQVDPAVAALTSGGFVIVWQDGNDESTGLVSDAGQDILAQSFTATGAETDGEAVVNVTTSGDLLEPSVAALTNGGYAVEFLDADSSDPEAVVDLFASGGTRVGGEQEIAAPQTVLPDAAFVDYQGVSVIAGQSGSFSLIADVEAANQSADTYYDFGTLGFSAAGVPATNWQFSGTFASANVVVTPPVGLYATAQTAGGETAIAVNMADTDVGEWFQAVMNVYVGGELFASIPVAETAPATSVALLALANSDLVLAWTDDQGLHTGVFGGSDTFTPATYVAGAAPVDASNVQLSALPDGVLETWVDSSGSVESQILHHRRGELRLQRKRRYRRHRTERHGCDDHRHGLGFDERYRRRRALQWRNQRCRFPGVGDARRRRDVESHDDA